MLHPKSKYRVFSILFLVSGFAGIIYESVWTQYIKLLAGHAAFAQSFILVIFLGGLAAGASLAAKFSIKLKNLFLFYALIEIAIGLLAMLFHPVFIGVEGLLSGYIYGYFPLFWSDLMKWGFALLITIPQTMLLGATFPLITGALTRQEVEKDGNIVAQFYSVNSLGAAAGILVSGFFLIEKFGLPGTMLIAGGVNILIGVVVLVFLKLRIYGVNKKNIVHGRDARPCVSTVQHIPTVVPKTQKKGFIIYIFIAAFFTGTASFIYEIGWIRMLSMVMGSSVHAFELMLSAFILGIGIGSYWIKYRIDSMKRPLIFLVRVQIVMGILAIGSLVAYSFSFNMMSWLLQNIERDGHGYFIYMVVGYGVAMLVMLPATICAGMTLPLMIKILNRGAYDERNTGRVYALNTLGGIAGVLVSVHIIMPLLGLKNMMVTAGILDMAVGIGMLTFNRRADKIKPVWYMILLCIIISITSFVFLRLDPIKMASGVYRYGDIVTTNEMLFHEDGKTSTISVYQTPNGNIVLCTNGKPDASINIYRQVSGDEATQVLLSALPLSLNPNIRNAAIIGLGSGKTAHVTLMNYNLQELHVVEIEPAVVEASCFFNDYNFNILNDERYALHMGDARTFFQSGAGTYDLIISEPSNPWISGIASLYSAEFYKMISGKLTDDGMFVQWMHIYEMDMPLLASVIKAFSPSFNDYVIYFLDDGDIAIIGKKEGRIPGPGNAVFLNPEMKVELSKLGLENMDDINLRYLGNKNMLDGFFFSYASPVNSDYFPVLEYQAGKIRFLQERASGLLGMLEYPAPILRSLQQIPPIEIDNLGSNYTFNIAQDFRDALEIYHTFHADSTSLGRQGKLRYHLFIARKIAGMMTLSDSITPDQHWLRDLDTFAGMVIPYLQQDQLIDIWDIITTSNGFRYLPTEIKGRIDLYRAVSACDYERIIRLTGDLNNMDEIETESYDGYRLIVTIWANLMLYHPDNALTLSLKFEQDTEMPVILRLLINQVNSAGVMDKR
nr:hypothetical protein [Bacteroidota bacterium]